MMFLFFKYILSIQICIPNKYINYFKNSFVWARFWYNGVPWNYLLQLKILWVVVRKRHNTQEQDKFWQARVYEGWTSKLMDRQIQLLKSFDIFRRWWVLTIILQKCFIILSADSIVVSCRNLLDENSQSYLLKWSRRYRLYIINSK